MKTITFPIGNYAVAIGRIQPNQHGCYMEIVSPSSCDENVYKPAESVQVFTLTAIEQLRDACNEAIEVNKAMNPPPPKPV